MTPRLSRSAVRSVSTERPRVSCESKLALAFGSRGGRPDAILAKTPGTLVQSRTPGWLWTATVSEGAWQPEKCETSTSVARERELHIGPTGEREELIEPYVRTFQAKLNHVRFQLATEDFPLPGSYPLVQKREKRCLIMRLMRFTQQQFVSFSIQRRECRWSAQASLPHVDKSSFICKEAAMLSLIVTFFNFFNKCFLY